MSTMSYPVEMSFPQFGGAQFLDTQLHDSRPSLGSSGMQYSSNMFQPSPFEPILPGEWLTPPSDSAQWLPAPAPWDIPTSSYSSSSSCSSSYDHFNFMQGFPCDSSPEFEAYSPPSTATSEVELPCSFDHFPSTSTKSLPSVPIVPSSNRSTPPAPARRMRRPSKESPKNIADDRKYQCDFCPVQMARLHDINRHMRIHTGVHPYACIGCGETFRRTDARTRHWCKQPECFRIHSAKAPASKIRRRIP